MTAKRFAAASAPLLLILAACGSDDPVTDADEAAPAVEVNAAIEKAESDQARAEGQAERLAEAEARGEARARETIRRSEEADTPASRQAAEDNYANPSASGE